MKQFLAFLIFQGINQSQCQWSSIFATTANTSLCKNELYQLLFGNDFKMRMQDNNFKVYNCPLCWWETSGHWYINLGKLAVKYLSVPATSAPSEHIWSQATRFLTVKQNRMSFLSLVRVPFSRAHTSSIHCHWAPRKKRWWRLFSVHTCGGVNVTTIKIVRRG